jgi:hypothetical protein
MSARRPKLKTRIPLTPLLHSWQRRLPAGLFGNASRQDVGAPTLRLAASHAALTPQTRFAFVGLAFGGRPFLIPTKQNLTAHLRRWALQTGPSLLGRRADQHSTQHQSDFTHTVTTCHSERSGGPCFRFLPRRRVNPLLVAPASSRQDAGATNSGDAALVGAPTKLLFFSRQL